VIVLDAGYEYDTPKAWSPSRYAFGHVCQPGAHTYGWGCFGLMPPVIQTAANFSANTPQRIYFVTTAFGSLPPQGTRINPSGALPTPGDGYSHPLNLTSNINSAANLATIGNVAANDPSAVIFFAQGPSYYTFDGFEFISNSTYAARPPTSSGYTTVEIADVGEGDRGARSVNVTNGGKTAYADGMFHLISHNYPWIQRCHIDSPTGPDMTAKLISPNANHTFFCDTYATHMVQGQSMVEFSWQNRVNGDMDVTVPGMASGGTKYSLTQCLAGATTSGDATLGNACVVDTSFQCDGATSGQCFKILFAVAQNATVATCTAALGTYPVLSNTPACFNSGVHTLMLDTVPATAPSRCYGNWTNPASDGSDCAAHWVGGGIWAAGTERAMISDAFQVAFDSSLTPQFTITGCTNTTTSTTCPQSSVDGTWLVGKETNNYSLTFTGSANTLWRSTHAIIAGMALPPGGGQTVIGTNQATVINSPTSATYTFTNIGGTFVPWYPIMIVDTAQVGGYENRNPRYQNPTSELDITPHSGIAKLSSTAAPYYGIDYCAVTVGDGTTGTKWSRRSSNQLIKGQSFAARCFLYAGTSGFTATGLNCSTSPCPASFMSAGIDIGSDITIDSVTVVNSTTLDFTAFVCDGITVHPGCQPQIMADMGGSRGVNDTAHAGPQFEHIYLHGAGQVLHTAVAWRGGTDPGPANTPCAGNALNNPSWFCYMSGGREIQQGVRAEGSGFSFRDSFIDNIWQYGRGAYTDAQGLILINGSGPTEILNNYIVASAEPIFSGGGGSTWNNGDAQNPNDVTIANNYIYKPPWWYNYGIGLNLPSPPGGFPRLTFLVKNQREQKSGARWEYKNNIMDGNFWGAFGQYAAFNETPRMNLCCGYESDIYSHDNATINNNQGLNIFGTDGNCTPGAIKLEPNCASGVFPPTQLYRFYMFNELFTFNQNESSPAIGYGSKVDPRELTVGQMQNHTELNHVTFTMQGNLTVRATVGLVYANMSADGLGPTGSCGLPDGRTIGPLGRASINLWIRNSIFFNGANGACGLAPGDYSILPRASGVDINRRWTGTVWPHGRADAMRGVNITNNYVGVSGEPSPFTQFANPLAATYLLDPNVGLTADYTLVGNYTNGTVRSQMLAGYIGPSATKTTDGVTAGVIMPRLLSAIANTANGGPPRNPALNIKRGSGLKFGAGLKVR